jgi:hypothetical protein
VMSGFFGRTLLTGRHFIGYIPIRQYYREAT